MLITPHMLIGAGASSRTSSIKLAFFLGWLSHYLGDFLPHWDYVSDFQADRWFFIKIGIDFLIGIIVFSILLWSFSNFNNKKLIALVGAGSALIPDSLEFIYFNFEGVRRYLEPLHKFHGGVHYWKYLSFQWEMVVIIITVSISIWLILRGFGRI